METRRFKRNIEDFTCGHCGREVWGDGYTNHCPDCLWSKHVDIHPGDRAALCGGLMKPENIEIQSGEYMVVHKCQRCGHIKRNKMQSEDDFDEVVRIATPKN